MTSDPKAKNSQNTLEGLSVGQFCWIHDLVPRGMDGKAGVITQLFPLRPPHGRPLVRVRMFHNGWVCLFSPEEVLADQWGSRAIELMEALLNT